MYEDANMNSEVYPADCGEDWLLSWSVTTQTTTLYEM